MQKRLEVFKKTTYPGCLSRLRKESFWRLSSIVKGCTETLGTLCRYVDTVTGSSLHPLRKYSTHEPTLQLRHRLAIHFQLSWMKRAETKLRRYYFGNNWILQKLKCSRGEHHNIRSVVKFHMDGTKCRSLNYMKNFFQKSQLNKLAKVCFPPVQAKENRNKHIRNTSPYMIDPTNHW